jgi:hypothetical protein
MAGLRKEIWVKQLLKNFYPETAFLEYVTKMDSLVENHKINLAEVGVDPNVLIDNTTYPIETAERSDTAIEITLKLFETENTLIRQPEEVERAYDKLESVIYGHKQALQIATAKTAAHAYAPDSHTNNTPVIVTTGEDNGEGFKRLTSKDIFLLKRKYDDADIPLEDRYLVLDPSHVEDLLLESMSTFKDVFDIVDGKPKKFAGFAMLQFSKNPKYNHVTKVKIPFGATGENETRSSFSFYSKEVMRANGQVKMYAKEDDPKERATIVGFEKRFVALPFRKKGIGAIISAKV